LEEKKKEEKNESIFKKENDSLWQKVFTSAFEEEIRTYGLDKWLNSEIFECLDDLRMIIDDLIYYEIFKSTEKFENVLFDWGRNLGLRSLHQIMLKEDGKSFAGITCKFC
jgi:transcriptional regulator of heat shock response